MADGSGVGLTYTVEAVLVGSDSMELEVKLPVCPGYDVTDLLTVSILLHYCLQGKGHSSNVWPRLSQSEDKIAGGIQIRIRMQNLFSESGSGKKYIQRSVKPQWAISTTRCSLNLKDNSLV